MAEVHSFAVESGTFEIVNYVEKQLKKTPIEVREKYEFWKNIIETDGPKGLKLLAGFKDHALKGEWDGARASRLNRQWRVIYTLEKDQLNVLVLEVNPHDYRKKG
jgi:addiction module RelE/StbE family toxin